VPIFDIITYFLQFPTITVALMILCWPVCYNGKQCLHLPKFVGLQWRMMYALTKNGTLNFLDWPGYVYSQQTNMAWLCLNQYIVLNQGSPNYGPRA